MNIPLVDLKAQYQSIKTDIDAAMQRVLDNTAFILGGEVATFEEKFATYAGAKHAIGVGSGTDALMLAMKALGIGSGDEVITTPLTFIATVEPLVHLGATPVFVDIDPATYNIDPNQIEAAITAKTKAIVPVHLYGQPANMDAIKAIAQKHGLYIIEDAAQAHGAEFNGQRIGSWGNLTCYSFYPGKNLGAYGDGGAVTTDDDNLAQTVRQLRDHGSANKYEHIEAGFTARLDGLQAAILAVKLDHIEAWTDKRAENARYYNQALAGIPGLTPPTQDERTRHVYHLYVIRVPGDRQVFFDAMRAKGVGVGIHYPLPLHLQPALAYLGYQEGDFQQAEAAAASIISLPMYPELTQEQISTIAETISEIIEQ